ncbi:hypothetical protein F3J23_10715 [Chryseobacterium sp. Tr-659]|uniref:hypothetical protein n=1 Tax=Chryseobacterium sp. Tr-659 TaxID=2608340 RepID=UPI001422BB6C|nr:hypothetical protein [Chryseobacterium sp. Tr-659]NIF05913.1 hypothetical protein [Chryseobacterium sp. Tr-659]
MATYESLIKITGAVGDLVFYNLNGKNVVRKKSGFNKTAFKKSASYEKVRQNSSEFGHCSKIGKVIRNSIDSYIKEAGDLLLYQKFAKLMTSIKDLDLISERGKRTVENGLKTDEGKNLLRGFVFGEKKNLTGCIRSQGQALYLSEHCLAEEATIITIKIDFESYQAEHIEASISFQKEKNQGLKEYVSENDTLLYFIALKDEKGEITHMGFL